MVDDEQIDQWLEEGTISEEQARKMRADTSEKKKEERSRKLIVTFSTIGAILVGIGAILFVAANWDAMSNFVKTALLVGSTLLTSYLGYTFRYERKNLPKVGASLMFLGALLFGATLFLVAQMYNIDANNHLLVLIWLVGVLPLSYSLNSKPLTYLSTALFLIWIGLFVFRGLRFFEAVGDFIALPALYLVAGIFLFSFGGWHYKLEDREDTARVYRILGLKTALTSLFFLTFRFFSGAIGEENILQGAEVSSSFTTTLVIFSLLAIVGCMTNYAYNQYLERKKLETWFGAGLTLLALAWFFFSVGSVFTVFFNLVFLGLLFTLIYQGYDREDIKLVNLGVFWFGVLVVVRYFDFFWDLLPRSLFFLAGGIILIGGGIVLERKRRNLKEEFEGDE